MGVMMPHKTVYNSGQMYKHKKYGFVIRLTERKKWNRFYFEVIKGVIPKFLQPQSDYDNNLDSYMHYSIDTIRTQYDLISGPAAEVLFGVSKPEGG